MLRNKSLQKVTTKNRGRTLLLERSFQTSQAALYKAYTEAELIKQWWGPHGWQLDYSTLEAVPGGTWHYCLKCVDESKEYFGKSSWGKAVFKTIEDKKIIQYEEYYSNEAGELISRMMSLLITVRFVEEKGKVKLVNEIDFKDKASLQKILNMGLVISLNEGWDKLDQLLKR